MCVGPFKYKIYHHRFRNLSYLIYTPRDTQMPRPKAHLPGAGVEGAGGGWFIFSFTGR